MSKFHQIKLWLQRRCPYCEEKHDGALLQCESCGETICDKCAHISKAGLVVCEREWCELTGSCDARRFSDSVVYWLRTYNGKKKYLDFGGEKLPHNIIE